MLAIVCPGQGAQTPGFLSPWLELPGVREHLAALSETAQLDLIAHGTVSDAETIKDTAVAQPLIVAASLVTSRVIFGDQVPARAVLAGHSVGEIPASALGGVFSEADAMRFVRTRSRGMADAAAATPTGMSAVVGGEPAEVAQAIEAAGLAPANVNGSGQTVAAGSMSALASLADNPPARARVIPLPVAGAFHTEYMSSAIPALQSLAAGLSIGEPRQTLLSNYDGEPVVSGEAALLSLIAQLSRPVRWDLCSAKMLSLGVTGLIELSPAGTLTGLAKRGMRGVGTVAVKTPDDIDAARALLDETS